MSRVRCAANAVGRPAMASATVLSVSGAAAVSAAAVRAASASSTCASARKQPGFRLRGPLRSDACMFHSSRGRAARMFAAAAANVTPLCSAASCASAGWAAAKGVETRRRDPGEGRDRIIIDHPGRLVGDGGRGSRQAFTRGALGSRRPDSARRSVPKK